MTTDNTRANIPFRGIRFFIFLSFFVLSSCSGTDDESQPEEDCPTDTSTTLTPYELGLKIPYKVLDYTIPSDNPLTEEGVQLGRELFYEKGLSLDSTVSCSSCHQQQFGFSDPDQLSSGVNGGITDRHSMALIDLLFQKEFFWDGRASSLEEQALKPIENPVEMNLSIADAVERLNSSEYYRSKFKEVFNEEDITASQLARAISQFERTLISQDSKYDQYKRGEYSPTEQELLGIKLFYTHPVPGEERGGNCGDCHSGNMQSRFTYHRNGIDSTLTNDEGRFKVSFIPDDIGKFKTPMLRNIAVTAPYMHDGRFATLEEVLEHYNEHININRADLDVNIQATTNELGASTLKLTEEEKEAIIAFMNMLTDQEFLENEKFSNPNNLISN